MVFTLSWGKLVPSKVTLSEIAARRRASLGAALCDLLLEQDLVLGYCIAIPQSTGRWRQLGRDAIALLARSDAMACSDITSLGSMCHPRSFGAYPRFLGRLRRGVGGISLETMINRMTDAPARRFGLTRRGRLERGWAADIVVFDPDRVIDTATYDDPRQEPAGPLAKGGARGVWEYGSVGVWAPAIRQHSHTPTLPYTHPPDRRLPCTRASSMPSSVS